MPDSANSKKVRPYPIELKIKGSTETLPAKILRVTALGLIAEIGPHAIKTGERYDCEFEIPSLKFPVAENAVVMKVYSQIDPQTREMRRQVEMHFTAITEKSRRYIAEFMRMIGDDGRSA